MATFPIRQKWLLLYVFCLLLILPACGGKGGGGSSPSTPASAAIGAAGGSLTSSDGKLTVTIPAGALGNTETITIESVDQSALPSEFSGGNSLAAYKLGPDGTQFSQPIEVSAKLDEQPVQADGSLTGTAALLLTSSNGVLELLEEPGMVLDAATNTTTVTGKLSHFSFVDLRAPEGVKVPHVQVTDLPNEMLVNAPQSIIVRADRSSSPSLNGAFTFDDEAGSDPLIFAGVGPEPIDVGSFTADVLTTLTLETEVGTYTCADAGTGAYNPRVYFSYFVELTGITQNVDVKVTYTKDATVACVQVLGVSPTVTSTSPSHGATNVPTDAVITAMFSEPMDPTTFEPIQRADGTHSSLYLLDKNGDLVPGDVQVSSDGLTAAFTPQSPLALNTNYTARVISGDDGAKDLSGNGLAADKTWTFTTGATGTGGGENTVNLSNATGSIQNVQANPACTVTPDPTGTEAAVLCEDATMGVYLAAYINLITKTPRLLVLQVQFAEIFFGVLDCTVTACTGIETNFTGDVISHILVSNLGLQFNNQSGQDAGSGTLNADLGSLTSQ